MFLPFPREPSEFDTAICRRPAQKPGAAGEDEILVSEITRTLALTSGLVFQDRGIHTLKGLPGQWRLFAYLADARSRSK
jgi:class 3 adenylate cyclase